MHVSPAIVISVIVLCVLFFSLMLWKAIKSYQAYQRDVQLSERLASEQDLRRQHHNMAASSDLPDNVHDNYDNHNNHDNYDKHHNQHNDDEHDKTTNTISPGYEPGTRMRV